MVLPSRARAPRGIGTALIERGLERLDQLAAPAYLESTNPANIPRYEASASVLAPSSVPPAAR